MREDDLNLYEVLNTLSNYYFIIMGKKQKKWKFFILQ
jgi:hypothetical protein